MSEPVPVLLMTQLLGSGGTERQLVETVLALNRSHWQPHVACMRLGFQADRLRAAEVPILELPISGLATAGAVARALELIRYLRRHRIRLAHAFDYPMTCYATPICRAGGTPVVLSSQRGDRRLNPPIYQRLARFTDRIVDGIVVNSEAMRRHLIEDEKVSARLIHLCRNGLDTTVFHPDRSADRPAALRDASLVIGSVCVLRPEKDLPTLLSAFARVRPLQPGMKLAIIGSGPELEALLTQANSLGVASDCHFEPATKDVPMWMKAIDIFVLPSLSEASSNALMEAMACGCAAIASNTGGNPEMVQHGVTGLLFEPGNGNELKTCLGTLIQDPNLRSALARAGSHQIRHTLALERCAARMGEIYHTFDT